MKASRLTPITVGVAAIGTAASLMLTVVPAQAVSSLPAPEQTCSSGQPKLDYEYLDLQDTFVDAWSNVCGTGTWTWNSNIYLETLRMPTSPYHRIWLHENPDGTGQSVCLYSQDNDVMPPEAVGWSDIPGNVQVSSNTTPC